MWSSGLRFFIHFSNSSEVWTTLSLVLRATFTGLGRFLASVAFSLAPESSLWLSIDLMSHWPDCWFSHTHTHIYIYISASSSSL
jgi:hypothetical protein